MNPLVSSLPGSLAARVSAALVAEASELAARWRAQAPSVAPRITDQLAATDAARGARVVLALAGGLRNDAGCFDAVQRVGWELGTAAHDGGSSLHYLLKELALLEAIVLYACERELRQAAPGAGAADGLLLARRLHRFFQTLLLAAAKGFTDDYVEDLQGRYRILRHDLRNPLGTIKSAMSLMSDQTVPVETRQSPRIQKMVERNATSLDQVIGQRLSDASTHESAFSRQEVSLVGVALAVRRELREEVAEAGCLLLVSGTLPTVAVDSTGLELALKSAVAAVAQLVEPRSTIHIEPDAVTDRGASLVVTFPPALPGGGAIDHERLAHALAFASELLGRVDGRLEVREGAVWIEVPLLAVHAGNDVPGAG